MAGPARMPTKLRMLRGNPGNHKINKNEPDPDVEIPDPPGHLDAYALEEWYRIAPLLETLGLISQIDRTALALYCAAYGRWKTALDHLRDEGNVLYIGESAYPSPNPWISIHNRAIDDMRRFLVEFGMTPSSRSKIAAPKAAKKTQAQEVLKR